MDNLKIKIAAFVLIGLKIKLIKLKIKWFLMQKTFSNKKK